MPAMEMYRSGSEYTESNIKQEINPAYPMNGGMLPVVLL